MPNELYIYDMIGEDFFGEGVTAAQVRDDIAGMDGDILLRINSPGGFVFEANAIMEQLASYRNSGKGAINVQVDGVAASAASFIATMGETVSISDGGMIMLHDPWSFVVGNRADMRKEASLLDKMADNLARAYAEKSGKSIPAVFSAMSEETWLAGQEAVDFGLADSVMSSPAAAFTISDKWGYKNAPQPRTPQKQVDPHDRPPSRHAAKLRFARINANVLTGTT